MMSSLQSFIDRTTMFRLVLYYLTALWAVALVVSVTGRFSFSTDALLWSTVVILMWSWLVNELFAWAFDAVTNVESVYITAFIVALIMPPVTFSDFGGTVALTVIAAWAMASKYLLAIYKKHLFNPVAIAVALGALILQVPATWWVAGNLTLLPFILIGGLMLVYKIRRWDLIIAFFVTAIVAVIATSPSHLSGVISLIQHSALFFFAFVMLTEPLTMPPTKTLRILYAGIIGVLFVPAAHIGTFYFSPELALIAGNVFSFFASPKGRHMLTFVERRTLASGIYEHLFHADRPLRFSPGQYLEWTLGVSKPDNRGNRRFFTIASAPEDSFVALGVRHYDKPSAFKETLASLGSGTVIAASSLAGDFTMPRDRTKKLAFLAGGIGVTPFVSMARHCIATNEQRDAVLLYSSKTEAEVAYRDVFSEAERVGLRTVFALSNEAPSMPNARQGFIDADFVRREVPDYLERIFYISGPHPMVVAMKQMLIGMGVSRRNIKTDFFPGLA